MDEKIRELQDRLLALNERAQVIQNTADAEKRDFTEEDQKELDSIIAQSESIRENIARRQAVAEQTANLSRGQGRQSDPQQVEPQNAADGMPAPRAARRDRPLIQTIENRGTWGWKHFGDFAIAVRSACAKGGQVDPRLVMNAPTTVSTEGQGADGGFAVPPEWRTDIWQKVAGEDSLFAQSDQYQTTKNTMVFPADETTPWDSSGGIQAYFESEGEARTQSKLALKEKTIRLNKLTALVPVTEELLEDAPGLDTYIRNKVSAKFDFKLNLKIVQGTGAGEPLGILNAASLVSVTKETSQAADTVVAANIRKIYSRMYAPCRRRAIWLINQDIEPQLYGMSHEIKNSSGSVVGGAPIYVPAGGLSASPYATLMGRPVFPTQACETLGDKGDIIFVDLSQYLTLYKTTGIKTDVSIHLWFDYDVAAYKFTLRIAGMPWWAAYITPRDGTNYLSWAVTLDERAA